MIKKAAAIFIILLMTFSVCASADGVINVNLDGKILSFDQYPVIVSGRTLVPLRKIFEELGGTVIWNEAQKSASSVIGSTEVSVTLDSDTMLVNGNKIVLDIPPQIIGGRMLVPIRAVSEAFGCTVLWDSVYSTVIIKTAAYVAKESSFLKYNSPFAYIISYPTSENYSVTFGRNVIAESDFTLTDNASGSFLSVVTIGNPGGSYTAFDAGIASELANSLGVNLTSCEVCYRNYMPSVFFTYEINGVHFIGLTYYTTAKLYTVTLALTQSVSEIAKNDLMYTLLSLGI